MAGVVYNSSVLLMEAGDMGEALGAGELDVAVALGIVVLVAAGGVASTCADVAVAGEEAVGSVSIVAVTITAAVGSSVIAAGAAQPNRVRNISN